jgi:hypothetical protein
MNKALSKSKLIAYRQCPKRVWLEVHRPALREDSAGTEARFAAGTQVGDIARDLYDPKKRGVLIDIQKDGFDHAFERTSQLLTSPQPIFEAGFRTEHALAFADVMLPVKRAGKLAWRLVEVKSSTSVKDYHLDDAAIQTYLARATGIRLAGTFITVIDNLWVYPGGGDYAGLLIETEVTTEAIGREAEVKSWIAEAHKVVARKVEPQIKMGKHCSDPFECGFSDYCRGLVTQAAHPITQLPGRLRKELAALVETQGLTELKEVPDELLNDQQLRVKNAALSGKALFDKAAAANALARHKLPAFFMDFETIQFAVPIWKGTRPYQMLPFQFSMHRLSRTGKLTHQSFLDLSGVDPSLAFAKALIEAVGKSGPIFVYNAAFESGRIKELANRFPRLANGLLAILVRIVDLLPVARNHYCHPSQEGSWSIKAVLPAIFPDLNYESLNGVQDGGMAMEAFLEAVHPDTLPPRRAEIEDQLHAYCHMDTYALVRLWEAFSGSRIKIS